MAPSGSSGSLSASMRSVVASFIRNILAHGQTPTAGLTDREADVDRHTNDLLRIIGDHATEVQQGQPTLNVSQLQPGGEDERVLLIQRVRELEGMEREKEAKNNDLKRELTNVKSQYVASVENWKASLYKTEEEKRTAERKLLEQTSTAMQQDDDRVALSKEVEKWKAQAQRAEENLTWYMEEEKKKMASSAADETTGSKPAGFGVPSNEVQGGIFRRAAEDSERESQMVRDLTSKPDDTHMPMPMPEAPTDADPQAMLNHYKYKSSRLLEENRKLIMDNSDLAATVERISANKQEYVPKEEAGRLEEERDQALGLAKKEEALRRDAEQLLHSARQQAEFDKQALAKLGDELRNLRNIKVSPPTSPRGSADPGSPRSDVVMGGSPNRPPPTLAEELGANNANLERDLNMAFDRHWMEKGDEVKALQNELVSRSKEAGELSFRCAELQNIKEKLELRIQELKARIKTLKEQGESAHERAVLTHQDLYNRIEQQETTIKEKDNEVVALKDQIKSVEESLKACNKKGRTKVGKLIHTIKEKDEIIEQLRKNYEEMRVPLENQLNTLVRRLNERDETITSLRDEIATLTRFDELTLDLFGDPLPVQTTMMPQGSSEEDYRKAIEDLEAAKKQLQSLVEEKEKHIAYLAEDLEDAEEKCEREKELLKKMGNDIIDEDQALIASLKEEIEEVKRSVEEKDARIQSLLEEGNRVIKEKDDHTRLLEDQIKNANEIVGERDARIQSLIDEGSKAIKEKDDHIKSLDDQIKKANEAIGGGDVRIQSLLDEVARLKKEIEELGKNKAPSFGSFEEMAQNFSHSERDMLQKEIERLRKTLEEEKEWSDEQQADIQKQDLDLNLRDERIGFLNERQRRAEELIQELRDRLDNRDEDSQDPAHVEEAKKLRAANRSLELKLASAQDRIEAGIIAVQNIQDANKSLETRLANLTAQNNTQVTDLRATIQSLQTQLASAQAQIEANGTESQNLRATVQSLETQLANATAQNTTRATEVQNLQARIQSLETQLANAREQNEANVTDPESLRATIQGLQNQIQELQNQLTNADTQNTNKTTEASEVIQELRDQNANHIAEVESLRATIKRLQSDKASLEFDPNGESDRVKALEEKLAKVSGDSDTEITRLQHELQKLRAQQQIAETTRKAQAEASTPGAREAALNAELNAELNAANARATTAEGRARDLEGKLKVAEQKQQELNRKLDKETSSRNRLNEDLDKTKKDLEVCLQRNKPQGGGGDPGDEGRGDEGPSDGGRGGGGRGGGDPNDGDPDDEDPGDGGRGGGDPDNGDPDAGDDDEKTRALDTQLREANNRIIDLFMAAEPGRLRKVLLHMANSVDDDTRREEQELQELKGKVWERLQLREALIHDYVEYQGMLDDTNIKITHDEQIHKTRVRNEKERVRIMKEQISRMKAWNEKLRDKMKDLQATWEQLVKDEMALDRQAIKWNKKIEALNEDIKKQKTRLGHLEDHKQDTQDELDRLREAGRAMEVEVLTMMENGKARIQSILNTVKNGPPEFQRRHKDIVEALERHRDDMRANWKKGEEIAESLARLHDVEAKNKLELVKAKEAASAEDDPELLARQEEYDRCLVQDGADLAIFRERKVANDEEAARIATEIDRVWERRVGLSMERTALYEKLKEFSGKEAFLLNETRQLGEHINSAVKVEMALHRAIQVSKAKQAAKQATRQETGEEPGQATGRGTETTEDAGQNAGQNAGQDAPQETARDTVQQGVDKFASDEDDDDALVDYVSVSSDIDYTSCLHPKSILTSCRICDICLRHKVTAFHKRDQAFWVLTIYLLLHWLFDQFRIYFRVLCFLFNIVVWLFRHQQAIQHRIRTFIASLRGPGRLLGGDAVPPPPPPPPIPTNPFSLPEIPPEDVVTFIVHIFFLVVVQVYITAKRERFLWLHGNPSSTSAYLNDLRRQLPYYRWFLDVDPRFMVDGSEVGMAMVRVRGEIWGGICAAYFYALDYLDKAIWFLLQRAFGWDPSFPAD